MFIGIAGKARSGKDTTAGFIKDLVRGKCLDPKIYSFASPLKNCINDWLRWGEEHGWGALKDVTLPIQNANFNTLPVYIWEHFNRKYAGLTPELCSASSETLKNELVLPERLFTRTLQEGEVVGSPTYTLLASPREVYQKFGTEAVRGVISDSFWVDIAPTENVIIADVRFENEIHHIKNNGGQVLLIKRENSGIKVPEHSSEQTFEESLFDEVFHNDGTLEDLKRKVEIYLTTQ
jgi:hypothetical protein